MRQLGMLPSKPVKDRKLFHSSFNLRPLFNHHGHGMMPRVSEREYSKLNQTTKTQKLDDLFQHPRYLQIDITDLEIPGRHGPPTVHLLPNPSAPSDPSAFALLDDCVDHSDTDNVDPGSSRVDYCISDLPLCAD